MKKVVCLQVMAAFLLLLFTTGAFAQYVPEYDRTQPNWNVHLGAAWMLGDTPDDVEFVGGLAYETPLDDYYSNWLGFSADYIPINTNGVEIAVPGEPVVFEGAGTVSYVPALIYWKRFGLIGDTRVYGMVGIGISWAEDDIPEMEISDGTNFAWMLGGGADITPSFFTQLRYIAGENPGDDGIVTTEIGWRF